MKKEKKGSFEALSKAVRVDGVTAKPKLVHFPSISPVVLKDLLRAPGDDEALEAHGHLFLPEGAAGEGERKCPGVVIAQGLGGQKPERELTYGHKLCQAGFAALVLDSFGSRGLSDAGDKRKALQMTTWTMMADAFAALRYLARHPQVDPRAIFIVGFSWGGMVSMLSVFEQIRQLYLGDDGQRFAGHVSYYGCSIVRMEQPVTTGAPVLVLVGEHDDNVSVARTREICDDMRRGGSAVDCRVYDAFHQWDTIDLEKRHNDGALADLHITITRDHELREESWNAELAGAVSRALVMVRGVDWSGYDILRDDKVHRETDELLLNFLGDIAREKGAASPDKDAVPLAATGTGVDAAK